MNETEKEIMEYLEESYCGERTMDDESCQVRLARAIAAFKADPAEQPTDLFTEKFIEKYCIEAY